LLHKKVSIEKVGKDKYNRTLAVVYLEDGTNFNELAAQRGQGQISYKYCHNQKMIEEMETAKRNRIGLWAKENVAPFIYRKNHKK
jgi:micrococcal nuclease